MKAKIFIPCMAFAFSWAAAGCLGRVGNECKMDSECRSGLICFIPSSSFGTENADKGTCRRPCLADEDCCPPDEDCMGSSVCVEGGACFPEPLLEDGTSDALDLPPEEPPPDHVACNPPTSFANTFKITLYHVGEDGKPGSGLDMDGNPDTCSPGQSLPEPLCSDGIDNGMAQLGMMGNRSLDLSITAGTMNIILELTDLNDAGSPFYLDYLAGIRQSGDAGCAQQPGCAYAASAESFDPVTCLPVSRVGNALLDGTTLTAGGDEFVYFFDAVVVGLHVVVPVLRPRVQAQVQYDGTNIVGISGILGGFIREEDFIGAFQSIPEDQYPPMTSKEDILEMWHTVYEAGQIEKDFDLDGDTVRESSSIGILFEAVPVSVSGVQ